MRTALAALAAIAVMIGSASDATAQRGKKRSATIGIVIDGPSAANKPIIGQFVNEIQVLAKGEFEVRLPANKRITANWTGRGVKNALDKLLADPSVDIVLAMGVPPLRLATLYFAARGTLDRHRRIARITLPIWLYVSFTGVLVYLVLYQLFPGDGPR